MAKRRTKKYTWFIMPLDYHTNKLVSMELDAWGLTEESIQRVQICEGGKRHNLLECPPRLIMYLWASRNHLNAKFKVYNRAGTKGKIREVTFIYRQELASTLRSQINQDKKTSKN